jgi:hypothetical protein
MVAIDPRSEDMPSAIEAGALAVATPNAIPRADGRLSWFRPSRAFWVALYIGQPGAAALHRLAPCFRREGWPAGRDTRGIFPVHKFDKVEMFSSVAPANSSTEYEHIPGIGCKGRLTYNVRHLAYSSLMVYHLGTIVRPSQREGYWPLRRAGRWRGRHVDRTVPAQAVSRLRRRILWCWMAVPRLRQTVVIAALACLCLTAVAQASETARLITRFIPNRLGASTTIAFDLTIASSNGQPVSPLTVFDLHMPAGMSLVGSTLGLATCDPVRLEALGLAGCSPNARIGDGSASLQIAFATNVIEVQADITALLGQSRGAQLTVLLYIELVSPVSGQLILSAGRLFEAAGPFGNHLETTLPVISAVEGGPDVAITRFSATLGPLHLTYYMRVHGRTVHFKPEGILVPTRCPRDGFPFSAGLGFIDGTHLIVYSTVPCPHEGARG